MVDRDIDELGHGGEYLEALIAIEAAIAQRQGVPYDPEQERLRWDQRIADIAKAKAQAEANMAPRSPWTPVVNNGWSKDNIPDIRHLWTRKSLPLEPGELKGIIDSHPLSEERRQQGYFYCPNHGTVINRNLNESCLSCGSTGPAGWKSDFTEEQDRRLFAELQAQIDAAFALDGVEIGQGSECKVHGPIPPRSPFLTGWSGPELCAECTTALTIREDPSIVIYWRIGRGFK
ncbi:hypothetical protein D3C87_777700 [compost metagenome]